MNSVVDGNTGLTVGRPLSSGITTLPGVIVVDLDLIISPTGDVASATTPSTRGETVDLATVPKLDAIVRQWKYVPFTKNGKPVTAEIKESLTIQTDESMPSFRVPPPVLRPDSKVTITLRRTLCFGTCPEYTVTIGTDGIVFEGQRYVVAPGKHSEAIDPNEVRKLAQKYVAADFYSMNNQYAEAMMDIPTYTVSIEIDGTKKQVQDYGGRAVGMPVMITELEENAYSF